MSLKVVHSRASVQKSHLLRRYDASFGKNGGCFEQKEAAVSAQSHKNPPVLHVESSQCSIENWNIARENALIILNILDPNTEEKTNTWIAGGYVRDSATGNDFNDYDIKTLKSPEDLKRILSSYGIRPIFSKHNRNIGYFCLENEAGEKIRVDFECGLKSIYDIVNPNLNSCTNFRCNTGVLDKNNKVIDVFEEYYEKLNSIKNFYGFKKYCRDGIILCVRSPEVEFNIRPDNIFNYLRLCCIPANSPDPNTLDLIKKNIKNYIDSIEPYLLKERLMKNLFSGEFEANYKILEEVGVLDAIYEKLVKNDPDFKESLEYIKETHTIDTALTTLRMWASDKSKRDEILKDKSNYVHLKEIYTLLHLNYKLKYEKKINEISTQLVDSVLNEVTVEYHASWLENVQKELAEYALKIKKQVILFHDKTIEDANKLESFLEEEMNFIKKKFIEYKSKIQSILSINKNLTISKNELEYRIKKLEIKIGLIEKQQEKLKTYYIVITNMKNNILNFLDKCIVDKINLADCSKLIKVYIINKNEFFSLIFQINKFIRIIYLASKKVNISLELMETQIDNVRSMVLEEALKIEEGRIKVEIDQGNNYIEEAKKSAGQAFENINNLLIQINSVPEILFEFPPEVNLKPLNAVYKANVKKSLETLHKIREKDEKIKFEIDKLKCHAEKQSIIIQKYLQYKEELQERNFSSFNDAERYSRNHRGLSEKWNALLKETESLKTKMDGLLVELSRLKKDYDVNLAYIKDISKRTVLKQKEDKPKKLKFSKHIISKQQKTAIELEQKTAIELEQKELPIALEQKDLLCELEEKNDVEYTVETTEKLPEKHSPVSLEELEKQKGKYGISEITSLENARLKISFKDGVIFEGNAQPIRVGKTLLFSNVKLTGTRAIMNRYDKNQVKTNYGEFDLFNNKISHSSKEGVEFHGELKLRRKGSMNSFFEIATFINGNETVTNNINVNFPVIATYEYNDGKGKLKKYFYEKIDYTATVEKEIAFDVNHEPLYEFNLSFGEKSKIVKIHQLAGVKLVINRKNGLLEHGVVDLKSGGAFLGNFNFNKAIPAYGRKKHLNTPLFVGTVDADFNALNGNILNEGFLSFLDYDSVVNGKLNYKRNHEPRVFFRNFLETSGIAMMWGLLAFFVMKLSIKLKED